MSLPKVLVVGSGGVGAITALSLALNGKADVTLVVRSDYDHVVKHGYEIDLVTYGQLHHWRPTHVARSVEAAAEQQGEFDFIMLTTKNIPDGPMTCEDIIRPAVTEGRTAIVLVQNGIGNEWPMFAEFPENVVLSGVQLIGSTNINCRVTNLHKDQLYLGIYDHPAPPQGYAARAQHAVDTLHAIYQNADEAINKVHLDTNVKQTRWSKLVYNSVLNTCTALVGIDINRCQIGGANEALFRPAMDEVYRIAASEGVEVAAGLRERFIHIGDGLFYLPSMLVDHRKGQLMELEVILGNPLKVARANGVATPILDTFYHLLTLVQLKLKEERGYVTIDEDDYRGKDLDLYPLIFAEANRR
jgi:2-dehydropantoate 2-reductase